MNPRGAPNPPTPIPPPAPGPVIGIAAKESSIRVACSEKNSFERTLPASNPETPASPTISFGGSLIPRGAPNSSNTIGGGTLNSLIPPAASLTIIGIST